MTEPAQGEDGPEAAEAPPSKGSANRFLWGALGALGAVLVVAAVVSGSDDKDAPTAAETEAILRELAGPVEVLYEVEGTASSVSVTIETPTGTSQASDRAVPLTTDEGRGIRMEFEPGNFVYISAQNEGERGEIICRITVDGEVISENSAEGAYAIATCDGST